MFRQGESEENHRCFAKTVQADRRADGAPFPDQGRRLLEPDGDRFHGSLQVGACGRCQIGLENRLQLYLHIRIVLFHKIPQQADDPFGVLSRYETHAHFDLPPRGDHGLDPFTGVSADRRVILVRGEGQS